MSDKFIIAPSILSSDFLHLGNVLQTCQCAGADWIHVDVMDGQFVPNLTMGPFIVRHCRRGTDLPLDVHLMVEKPEGLLEAFAEAGASHLTVHVETCPHLYRTLQEIKALGCLAGVTLNPGTPLTELQPVLPIADLVLVMSVNPGFSYQSFLPEALGRIRQVRQLLTEMKSSAHLEVDGGVSPENIAQIADAGANAFVSANAIFNHPQGAAAGVRALRQAAEGLEGKRARPA